MNPLDSFEGVCFVEAKNTSISDQLGVSVPCCLGAVNFQFVLHSTCWKCVQLKSKRRGKWRGPASNLFLEHDASENGSAAQRSVKGGERDRGHKQNSGQADSRVPR